MVGPFLSRNGKKSAKLLLCVYVHMKHLLQMTMVLVYQWFVIAL